MKLATLFLFLLATFAKANKIVGESYPDNSAIQLYAQIGILPSGGFFPLRVEVENNGSDTKVWNLETNSNSLPGYYSMGMGGREDNTSIISNFQIECPAGENKVVDLLIPAHQKVVGGYQSRSLTFQATLKGRDSGIYDRFETDAAGPYLGLSKDLHDRFSDDLYSTFVSKNRRYSYRVPNSENIAGKVSPDRLPQDWRAYGGYDALIFSRQDYQALSTGVLSAIEKWMLNGGTVIILKDGKDVSIPGLEEGQKSVGLGKYHVLDCGSNFDDFSSSDLLDLLDGVPLNLASITNGEYSSFDWSVAKEMGIRNRNTALLLLALVVFAIIVGPVNLFYFADKNRRHRLFITTPIISIAASLLLITVIVLRDGFGGEGTRAVAIEVGAPGTNSAAIVQEQFSRSGILLSSGFEIDDHSIMMPVRAPTSDLNEKGSAGVTGHYDGRIEQQKDGWKISGNFFESRSEQAQLLRSVVPSRERLELLTERAGPPQITSSFSYPLREVFYRDSSGGWWSGGEIAPGETITLKPSFLEEAEAKIEPVVNRFGESYRTKLEKMFQRKGSFCALADEAPSISSHPSIDWKESPALVTGILVP